LSDLYDFYILHRNKKMEFLHLMNKYSQHNSRDGCMFKHLWACADTKFFKNLFFSSIMYQWLTIWSHGPHLSQIIFLFAHTYHHIYLKSFFDNMNRMRNRMGDDWLNDCLVVYMEGDIFIDIEKTIQCF